MRNTVPHVSILCLAAVCVLAIAGCAARTRSGPAPVAADAKSSPTDGARADRTALPPVLVVIDTSQFAPLPLRFFSLNADMTRSPMTFDNGRFLRAVRRSRPASLSYPGGEIANFWDWTTGLVENEWVESLTVGPAPADDFAAEMSRAARWNLAKGGASFDAFLDFCHRMNAQPVCTVNVARQSPEDAAVWALYARSHGRPVGAWEFGRGLFRPAYRTLLPEPEDYADMARPFAEALAIADPDAQRAVHVPVSALTANAGPEDDYARRWVEALAREDFFDTVAIEIDTLPSTNGASSLTLTAREIGRFVDTDLPEAVERCARLFGRRPVWVSDCGVGGGEDDSLSENPTAALALAEIAIALSRKTPLVQRVFFLQASEVASPEDSRDLCRRIESRFQESGKTQRVGWLHLSLKRSTPAAVAAKKIGSLFAGSARFAALDSHRPPRLSCAGRAIPASEATPDDPRALAASALVGKDLRQVKAMVVNRSTDPLGLRVVINRRKIEGTIRGEVLECNPPLCADPTSESAAGNGNVRFARKAWKKGEIVLPPHSLTILDLVKR
ncbi:hypothetical protein JW916_06540 [Candidatus Sumerlaeota bacterium]|nr:hypothetical protein [Candidatus Sumerlaeota bacterium]